MEESNQYWDLTMGGSLRIASMRHPEGEWDPSRGDHHLTVEIEPWEWEELFFNVLGAQHWEALVEGEGIENYNKRQELRFAQNLSTKGYEMLGRISDIYQDVAYLPSEVNKLSEECLNIQKETDNAAALSALRKLVFACDDAQATGSGLRLISD